MKAKLIKEELFVPKNEKELEKAHQDFFENVGTRFSDKNKTLKRLQEFGIDCKMESFEINKHEMDVITLGVFDILKTIDGSLQKIGDVYREIDGEKVINFLKNNMDFIGNQFSIDYKIVKRSYRQPMTNILCLKLLAKLENES